MLCSTERRITQPMTAPTKGDPAILTAQIITDAFAAYHATFNNITHKAKQRFEQCDWHGLHEDAQVRLDLYKDLVASTVNAITSVVGERAGDKAFWVDVKRGYTQRIEGRSDLDLAESFYNSVT